MSELDQTVVNFESVSFKYPKSKVPLLNDINFLMEKGDRVGIVGGNGSGKSTLIKLIFGIYPVTEGQIQLCNGPVSWEKHYPSMGYIGDPGYDGHSLGLPVELKVKEVLNVVFDLFRNRNNNDLIYSLTSELGLSEIENRLISNLSTGERKRLMAFLTFVKKPNFIILDEPFDGLDKAVFEKVKELLALFLSDPSNTMLFISHSQVEIESYCDKIFLLQEGCLIPFESNFYKGEIDTNTGKVPISGKTGKVIGSIIETLNKVENSNLVITLKSKK